MLPVRNLLEIKVEFDVSMPLKIGFLFPCPFGNPVKISFKYEKLSNFCYHCGRIGHSINSCGDLESLSDVKYGPDLGADPWEVRKINRNLFFAHNLDHQSFAASISTPAPSA